ncbi:MAG: DUF3048 domain-containing protein [Candidatus Kerfeldbacteria bacterium]|nr:DUF3048 domain-containing protein [Candidatus Kerfeldbacteria bacterium]
MPKKTSVKVVPTDDEPSSRSSPTTPARRQAAAEQEAGTTGRVSEPKPTVFKKPASRRVWLPAWAWYTIGGVVVVTTAMIIGFALSAKPPAPPVINTNRPAPTAQLVPRRLDGVMVETNKDNPNIYAVMIENLTDSRPPSGLDRASVVYEALAEGGITRFMALIPVGQNIPELGPIRSARRYYLAWAEEYNRPLYVHVGGSPDALAYLRSGQASVVNFNQFYNAGNFWRERSRRAPHNLYSSSDMLFLGLRRVAPDLVPEYAPWPFKDDAAESARSVGHPTIVIEYSSFSYRVTYKYHPQLNRYFRFLGDSDHLTRSGDKIWAKTVVVMFVKTGLLSGDRQRLQMETEGEGRALVFRDGQVVEGTWKKPTAKERTTFLDQQGRPITFNRGPIWISVVPTDRQVTY